MTLGFPSAALLLATVASISLAAGCGHSEGRASNPGSETTVTLGTAAEIPAPSEPKPATEDVVPASASDAVSAEATSTKPTEEKPAAPAETTSASTNDAAAAAQGSRTFKVEGPEGAIRVSFDDVDLLKVMNLDPVPADAPERLPKWLKALDGKRIRVRGFMYPPFQDTDIRGFVLARDNQICCFGRTPKEYDLIDIFLRNGVSTHYIQNRPFDVVGVFRIKSEIEKYTAMYEMEDAIVIEK